MLTILASTGRLLAAHWPAVFAWLLGGLAAREGFLALAGLVGGRSSTFGILLLPLASLANLASFVGAFLVLRQGLRQLTAIAPAPEDAATRRSVFLTSLLGSILPFLAVYTAIGGIERDKLEYTRRALNESNSLLVQSIVDEGPLQGTGEVGAVLGFNVLTISIIVTAFLLRWAWRKWGTTLPKAVTVLAVYCELIWVYFSVLLIAEALFWVRRWVEQRVAMVWLADIREWFVAQLAPVAWIWDALNWVIGEFLGLIGQPLAWLTVAGVIYGQAVAAQRLEVQIGILQRAKKRAEFVPEVLRTRAADAAKAAGARFISVWNAIVLMWRAGPLFIGSYLLLYVIARLLEPLGTWALWRVIGPHDLHATWQTLAAVTSMLVVAVAESIRVPLIAASYDRTIGLLRRQPEAAAPPSPAASTPSAAE